MAELLSFEKYAKIEFTHAIPYILAFKKKRKEILYIGTKHTFNPNNKNLTYFKNLILQYKPDCILLEGDVRNQIYKTKKEAVKKAAEMGYIKYIADKSEIRTESLEMPFEQQLEELAKSHTLENIFLFVTVRAAPFGIKFIEQEISELKKYSLFRTFKISYKYFKQRYKESFGKSFSPKANKGLYDLTSPTKYISMLNEISRKNNYIRDQYMILKVQKELKTANRLMVFVGASHVVIQEPVLQEKFTSVNTDMFDEQAIRAFVAAKKSYGSKKATKAYDPWTVRDNKDYKLEVRKIRAIASKHGNHDNKTLLDIGCGTGTHLMLLENYYNCIGIDPFEEMLEHARKKTKKTTFIQADMRTLRLNKTFDVIISLYSAISYSGTYPVFREVMENIYNHLNPGGVVIIDPFFQKDPKIKGDTYWLYNDPEKWLKIMTEVGFAASFHKNRYLDNPKKGLYILTRKK
ncbi:MAG: class I SAM-dependent DNA methyltransferase [Candidatus Woesearchaeota archaeon]